MAEVAAHINAMKRKYDTAVHVQELQSLVRGNEVSCVGRGGGGGDSLVWGGRERKRRSEGDSYRCREGERKTESCERE